MPQCWPYPGVGAWHQLCTQGGISNTAQPSYPESMEEKRPRQGEERKGPDSPKQDEWKTRVQKDRVIVLSKGKRIIRSSKHKPQKIKENEMEIIKTGRDIKTKRKEKTTVLFQKAPKPCQLCRGKTLKKPIFACECAHSAARVHSYAEPPLAWAAFCQRHNSNTFCLC